MITISLREIINCKEQCLFFIFNVTLAWNLIYILFIILFKSDLLNKFLSCFSFQNLKRLAVEDPGKARARLRGVRGYLVQLPLCFLEKEDLRPPVGSSEYFVSDGVFT